MYRKFFYLLIFIHLHLFTIFDESQRSSSGEPWRETAESILKSDDPHQWSHWGDCFQEDLYLISTSSEKPTIRSPDAFVPADFVVEFVDDMILIGDRRGFV